MASLPVGSSAAFFRSSDEEPRLPRVFATSFEPHADKKVCRWCLEVFDPDRQQPRSTRERGYLRTHLKMADNGNELVCCDNCWQAAIGARTLMQGVVVPCDDPEEVKNPLLRALA